MLKYTLGATETFSSRIHKSGTEFYFYFSLRDRLSHVRSSNRGRRLY